MPPALAELDVLGEPVAWGAEGLSDGRASAGSLGLGNGLVFALVGLGEPWSTLSNAVGPGYQASDGFFGDSALGLLQGGVPLSPEREALQRPRGLSVARTLARAGGLAWSSTDLAVPGEPLIARHLTVWNEGEAAAADLVLRLTLARAEGEDERWDEDGLVQRRGERRLRVRCPEAGWSIPDEAAEALDLAIPALEAGEAWSVTCLYVFDENDTSNQSIDFSDALRVRAEADAALLARAARLQTPEPAVADLLEGLVLTLDAQTAQSGLVSPMSRYTSGWLRDVEGALRLQLALGLYEEARAQLDLPYLSAIRERAINNSFPLDLDLSGVEEPSDPAAFWAEAGFMEGREAAEAPSYPVLHHARYLRQTGDATPFTQSRLAYLEACVTRQSLSEDGLLPWSGDETWRWPFLLAHEVGLPEETGWSLGSGLLYVAAAEAAVELGADPALLEGAARAREAIGALYWQEEAGYWSPFLWRETLAPVRAPYEDPATFALWHGVPGLDPEQLLRNLDATRAALLQPDGALASAEAPGAFVGTTGMVQPMWLQNLAAVHAEDEEAAWDALNLLLTPSGHVEELHGPDRLPLDLVHQVDGLGADLSARYRPWESGDLGFAVLDYLIGAEVEAGPEGGARVRLSPHLPHGWPALRAEDLPAGDGRYTLVTEQYEQGMVARVERDGAGGDWTLDLVLHGAAPFTALWVDGVRQPDPGSALGRAVGLSLAPGQAVEVIAVY